VETPESVSMRDVKRCKTLIRWFKEHLNNKETTVAVKTNTTIAIKTKKGKARKKKGKRRNDYKKFDGSTDTNANNNEDIINDDLHAVILALALCYHTRLGSAELRHQYRCIIKIIGCCWKLGRGH
jgi:hypothetical protein